MRKYFDKILLIPVFIYFVIFIVKAQSIASLHMDLQILYPVICMAIGALIAIISAFAKKKKYAVIGVIYLLCGIATFIVGYCIPCCVGG